MSLDEARKRVRAAKPSRNGGTAGAHLPTVNPTGVELVVTPLAALTVRPVKYLIPGRIPLGKLILVGGRGGGGKSTLLRKVAADLSAGRCCFGLRYDNPPQVKTLIVAAEDGPQDTILPGLMAEGADLTRIAIIEGVKKGNAKTDFTLAPEHLDLVRERLAQSPDIGFIVLDPIASFVSRAKVDDHRATELRRLLDPLSALAESTGTTIAMIAHLNKGTGEAVDRIAGSAAYRDAVRAAYLVTEDPEDSERRLFMPVKDNLPGFERSSIPFGQAPVSDEDFAAIAKQEQFRGLSEEDLAAVRSQLRQVRFGEAQSIDPNATMKAKKSDTTKVQKCKEWLKVFLKQYAFPSNEILAAAKKEGFSFECLKDAKTELKDDGILANRKSAKFKGEWWSGLGDPSTWTDRPESTPSYHSSPYLPSSPSLENQGESQRGLTRVIGASVGIRGNAPDWHPDRRPGEGGTL